ncbi:MAG: adenylate/guanylate cyclase domain-containing protein [Crocinitomicaceae bacterium]|nr:adenylate/guanylate cyclase domain-containing protein [Crocinitomicaceae bacterium]
MGIKYRTWLRRATPYGIGSILTIFFAMSPIAESINLLTYDLVLSTLQKKNTSKEKAKSQVVVVGINENDINQFGWPINDNYLCKAIKTLSQWGAASISLDLYRDVEVPPKNTCLREIINTNEKLISIRNIAENIPAIPGTPDNQQGFNDLVVDSDGVIRRDLVHVSNQELSVRSLALRILEVANQKPILDKQIEALPSEIWLSKNAGGYLSLPGAGYQTMLDTNNLENIRTKSLSNVLNKAMNPSEITGRIVLIGSTAKSVKDVYEIPQSRFHSGDSYLRIPGVKIHALRVINLTELIQNEKAAIHALRREKTHLLAILLFIFGIALVEIPKSLKVSILCIGVTTITIGLGLILLQAKLNIWIGLSLPISALVVSGVAGSARRGLVSQQHQKVMQKLLGQTSSPAVAEQLWERRNELLQNGRFLGKEQWVTILFTDTCNFTTVSEQLTPSELMNWLNRGMSIAVDAVNKRNGMVNKFTGDGMLAVFGAPLSQGRNQDAKNALEAAEEIQTQFKELNRALKSEKTHKMKLRIGIHSGIVLTGSLGNTQRLEYAVMGDTVNCASRLESYEKSRQNNLVRVLVSSVTRENLDSNDKNYFWESWGALKVKGRREELIVYELKDNKLEDEQASR